MPHPDLVSALQRRVREGFLEVSEAERLAQQVIEHMGQSYALAAIRRHHQACTVLHRYPLRAYDALHLACALTVREAIALQQLAGPVLVAADAPLLAAAAAEGLPIDNPLQHS